MNSLQAATEKICELKGSLLAVDTLMMTLLQEMPAERRAALHNVFQRHAEVARTVLLHTPISDHTITAFDRDARRIETLLRAA